MDKQTDEGRKERQTNGQVDRQTNTDKIIGPIPTKQ